MAFNNVILISFILIGILYFVSSTGVPVIQSFSFPSVVIKGQSLTLTCSVTAGTGMFTFTWTKNGQELADQPLTRIQTFEEYSLLFLKSVDVTRNGNFTCIVSNLLGSANQTAELVVFEHPEWTVLPEDAEVVQGDRVRLDCAASGTPEPKVVWRKMRPSGTSSAADRGRHQLMPNGSLLMSDVSAENGGDYECSVSNGIGDGLKKIVTLTVHIPPHFLEPYYLQKAKSGHSTVLRCDVTGDAPIQVKWMKEYMDKSDNRYKVQETPLPQGLLSELYIARVVRKDAGLYLCSATNSFGTRERTVKLLVLEPPSPPSDVSVREVEKTAAVVHWNIPYGGNSPIVRYVLQFWKDTGSTPKLEELTIGSETTSESLRGLHPGTSYVVRIVAENEFGSSSPSVPVRFYTDEDAPSGYPTDLTVASSSLSDLTVRWKAPAPEQRNGAIQGFELGYREHYSRDPYQFREASLGPSATQELILDNLRQNTEYEIVVRAYNRAGKGPTSVPVLGKTREKGNLLSPTLWVESTSATSIILRWSGNEDIKNVDLRYIVHYRAEGKKWISTPGSSLDVHVLSDLDENTMYFVYVQAASGREESEPSATLNVRTADPSFERSSMTQMQEVSHQTTLVISLSVVISCVVIVCVIAGACVYVTRVNSRTIFKRDGHQLSDFAEQGSTPASRRHSTFRYVDVGGGRPLLWCSTPAPGPADYPSPYATLPLRPTPLAKRWRSEDGMSPAPSDRSESLLNQRVDISDDKVQCQKE